MREACQGKQRLCARSFDAGQVCQGSADALEEVAGVVIKFDYTCFRVMWLPGGCPERPLPPRRQAVGPWYRY